MQYFKDTGYRQHIEILLHAIFQVYWLQTTHCEYKEGRDQAVLSVMSYTV